MFIGIRWKESISCLKKVLSPSYFTRLGELNQVLKYRIFHSSKTQGCWYETIVKICLPHLNCFLKERVLDRQIFPTPKFLRPEPKNKNKSNGVFFLAWGLFMKTEWVTRRPKLYFTVCGLKKKICLCGCFHSFSLPTNHGKYFPLLFWSLGLHVPFQMVCLIYS